MTSCNWSLIAHFLSHFCSLRFLTRFCHTSFHESINVFVYIAMCVCCPFPMCTFTHDLISCLPFSLSPSFSMVWMGTASPKWVLKPNQEYSVLRGKKLVIDCQSEGVPSPTHQWKRSRIFTSPSEPAGSKNDDVRDTGMKEFTGIVSGPHLHVLENGSLAIIDAEKSDEGEYLCESSNGIGSVLTTSTNVKVRSAPSFGKSFEVIKSREGGKAVLTCDVFGDEPIKLIWSKERQVLSNSYSISSKHIIEESTNGNSAAAGTGGTSKADGVTRTSKLFVDDLHVSDSSLYICTASNPYGKDQKNFQLVVQGSPQAPSNFVASQISSRTLQLEWTQLPGTDSNSPITNFIIQFIPVNGTNPHFDFLSLSCIYSSVTPSNYSLSHSSSHTIVAMHNI